LIFNHLFIKVPQIGKQQRNFSVKLPSVTTSLTIKAIPLSALPKDTTSKFADLFTLFL